MNDHKCLQGNDTVIRIGHISSTGKLLDRLGNSIKYIKKMKIESIMHTTHYLKLLIFIYLISKLSFSKSCQQKKMNVNILPTASQRIRKISQITLYYCFVSTVNLLHPNI
jgi:hypothetical protein